MMKINKKLILACTVTIGIIYASSYMITQTQATSLQIKHSQSASVQKYKDGTYTGSGINRLGTIKVSLSIKKGRITAIETIKNSNQSETHDSTAPTHQNTDSDQSTKVDAISGATRNTENFIHAVRDALQHAE